MNDTALVQTKPLTYDQLREKVDNLITNVHDGDDTVRGNVTFWLRVEQQRGGEAVVDVEVAAEYTGCLMSVVDEEDGAAAITITGELWRMSDFFLILQAFHARAGR